MPHQPQESSNGPSQKPCALSAEPSAKDKSLLFNARSIVRKLSELNILLNDDPVAVCITESWLKPHLVHDATLTSNGRYAVFRCDREGARPDGGVAAIVRKGSLAIFCSLRIFPSIAKSLPLTLIFIAKLYSY